MWIHYFHTVNERSIFHLLSLVLFPDSSVRECSKAQCSEANLTKLTQSSGHLAWCCQPQRRENGGLINTLNAVGVPLPRDFTSGQISSRKHGVDNMQDTWYPVTKMGQLRYIQLSALMKWIILIKTLFTLLIIRPTLSREIISKSVCIECLQYFVRFSKNYWTRAH